MASKEAENHHELFEDVMRQISRAVQNIEWSYAIFWSVSATQPGVLKWGGGFYNGEIKTKNKAHAAEQTDEETCSQRTDRLQELFESLAASESNIQAKRLPATLSPEDLTETQWFYLVCMSFVFNAGQELPGKALAKGQHVWLCNAHLADNKVFGRSLLAKTASIKTVACFPISGGVVELGVTEKVSEDPALVERIKSFFVDGKSITLSTTDLINTKASSHPELNILDTELAPKVSSHSTADFGLNELEDSFMVDSINEGVAGLENWHFMDEELNNYVCSPVNHPSNGVSQCIVRPETIMVIPEKIGDQYLETRECQQMKNAAMNLPDDEMHYKSVISTILQTSIAGPKYGNANKPSSFVSYQKGGNLNYMGPYNGVPQRMLKRVLIEVARKHTDDVLQSSREECDKNALQIQVCEDTTGLHDAEDIDIDLPEENGANHVVAERRRREKLKRRFLILRSLVPTTTKVDKISILDDTIKYLKELERRIEEFESANETTNTKTTRNMVRKFHDSTEKTSDNCETEETPKSSKKKRKLSHGDENGAHCASSKHNASDDLVVEVADKNVRIELRCPWRKRLLPELMDTLSILNIDSLSVQTSTTNGITSLKITSKLHGLRIASTKMIKQEMQKIINNH